MRKILIIFALLLTYSNVDAQESIPLIYDKAFSVDIGYTAVIKERKVGLMNPDGKFVTKMEYDNILPNYEGFLCVAKNGKYGFINLKGEEIIPCIYDEPSNFSEGAASVKKDGLWGILKKDGQMLLPCESKYRIGPFKDGYASITEGFFEELSHIDHNGRIIPDSLFFDPNKPLPRQVENGMAYLDKKGNRVIPQTFAYAEEFKEGLAWVRTDRTWGFINLQGKMVAERYMNRVPLGSNDMAYNGFTIVIRDNKYGLINSQTNKRAFSQDSSYCLLAALEVLDENGELKRKADIFTKRTIRKPEPVESVDTASEALALSIGERARVDLPYMASLCGRTEDEIINELRGVIFLDPESNEWQTSDEYLSGNVREKLRVAQSATERDPAYQVNVEYLKRVQPKDLDASEIEVRLGATWIDPQYIDRFIRDEFHTDFWLIGRQIKVQYSKVSGLWNIQGKSMDRGNPMVYSTYGTERLNAFHLLEDALNLKDTKVYDTFHDADGDHRVLNKKETMLAQQKQELIRAAFKEWIFKDMRRRETLVARYNELFNAVRPREYDGSHIRFVGMTPEITLMQHQKNAIAHILYGENVLLAHCVGAGKTFQMIAAGMEARRLGLSQTARCCRCSRAPCQRQMQALRALRLPRRLPPRFLRPRRPARRSALPATAALQKSCRCRCGTG